MITYQRRPEELSLVAKRQLENSPIISVVGINTGDEGKGRTVTDTVKLLSKLRNVPNPVHMVFKVNGGSNSGHTVDGLKHNLVPGGIKDPNIKFLALGRGVVADPRKLLWEITVLKDILEKDGVQVDRRIKIDNRCMVSDLSDRLLDLAGELSLQKKEGTSRGSTGRGIAPAFEHEANHSQIFFETLIDDPELFATQLTKRMEEAGLRIRDIYQLTEREWYQLFEKLTQAETKAHLEPIRDGVLSEDEFNFKRFATSRPFELNHQALIAEYFQTGQYFKKDLIDVGELALEIIAHGHQIIAEHGQSYGLDKRHGLTPFSSTSSHTYTPEVWQSLDIPSQITAYIQGVCKAYDTKVGNHIFLTQIEEEHPLRSILEQVEFGTSTGRQRMVGWSDLVEKGHTLRRGGYDDLIINKLDMLTASGDWQGPLKACVAYEDTEGHKYYSVPSNNKIRAVLKPVYVEMDVWKEDISGIREFEKLPQAAKDYIVFSYSQIVTIAETKGNILPSGWPTLRFVGVGPDSDQIISDIPAPHILMAMADQLKERMFP